MNNNNNSLVEGRDYYFNSDGFFVFTEQYHLNRGYCCNSGCLHCPYRNKDMVDDPNKTNTEKKESENS